jgi:hypothetical protein
MIDSGFDLEIGSSRETPGLGYEDRQTFVCVQGGVAPKCPEGQTAVWDQSRCSWVCRQESTPVPDYVCVQGGAPPACPEGQIVWNQVLCRWECRPGTGSTGGGPLDRVADVIGQVLAGGGGGIIIPQIPQPQAVVAPATERRYNPAAIVLLVAGLALGGYYVYQRTRRS